MFLIAHRGNTDGPDPLLENSPMHVESALENGFDVEIDVWWNQDGFYLGHDKPLYPIHEKFLENPRLWCHAKNMEALRVMLMNTKIHCFAHEIDAVAITSERFMWTYPGINGLTPNSIAVMPEHYEDMPLYNPESWRIWHCAGICTDYARKYKEYSEKR